MSSKSSISESTKLSTEEVSNSPPTDAQFGPSAAAAMAVGLPAIAVYETDKAYSGCDGEATCAVWRPAETYRSSTGHCAVMDRRRGSEKLMRRRKIFFPPSHLKG